MPGASALIVLTIPPIAASASLGHDLRFGVLQVELRGEGLRGLVVSGSHAGGEDQNSRGCVRRTRGRLRFAERGRDESPFTLRDSTAPGWSLRLAPGFDVAAV